jgi:hypothetical protein
VYFTETRKDKGLICCKICECAEMMLKHYNREKVWNRDKYLKHYGIITENMGKLHFYEETLFGSRKKSSFR